MRYEEYLRKANQSDLVRSIEDENITNRLNGLLAQKTEQALSLVRSLGIDSLLKQIPAKNLSQPQIYYSLMLSKSIVELVGDNTRNHYKQFITSVTPVFSDVDLTYYNNNRIIGRAVEWGNEFWNLGSPPQTCLAYSAKEYARGLTRDVEDFPTAIVARWVGQNSSGTMHGESFTGRSYSSTTIRYDYFDVIACPDPYKIAVISRNGGDIFDASNISSDTIGIAIVKASQDLAKFIRY